MARASSATMARTAVIAGTATAVSGAVVNHQQGKQMEKQAEVEAQYQAQADATQVQQMQAQLDAMQAQQAQAAIAPAGGPGSGPRGRRLGPARPAHPAAGAEGRRRPERCRVRRREGEAPRELIPTGTEPRAVVPPGATALVVPAGVVGSNGAGRLLVGIRGGFGSGRDRRRRPPLGCSIAPTPRTRPSGRSSPGPGPFPTGRAPVTIHHGHCASSSPMTPT